MTNDRAGLSLHLAHLVIVTAVSLGLASCSSNLGIDAGGEWTRSYLKPYDEVVAAAVRTLGDLGASIDSEDPGRGRIEGTLEQHAQSIVLDVRIDRRDKAVRVDVLARSGVLDVPAQRADIERTVRHYLDQLDRTLRTRAD